MLSCPDSLLWRICCGKRTLGGYSGPMYDYSKIDRVVPTSKFGFAFSALLLLCASSSTDGAGSTPACSKISHWIYNEKEFSEIESFTEITVNKHNYRYMGYKIRNDKELAKALKKQIDEDKKMSFNPRHIFLRSNRNITCERFIHAASVVASHYACKNGNLCIWAYGLGEGAMPLGIDPPPGATVTELR